MSYYQYEWVYKWSTWKRFGNINIPDLKSKIEKKIREKMGAQKTVKKILSIVHSDIKEKKKTVMGIYHHEVSGTTTTRFVSTIAPKSPIAPAVVAICVVAGLCIVAFLAYLAIKEISSTVKYIGEVAPEALPALARAAEALPYAAVGLGAIALVGLLAYAYMKRKR